MSIKENLINFCEKQNYDIRKSKNGRWIDQKCTPDVINIVADCIYNYQIKNNDKEFKTRDIWDYEYTIINVRSIFKKPDIKNSSAKNEYDKFFQQPMEMLTNAGILRKVVKNTRNFYQVVEVEILEYIAFNVKNSLFFLDVYITNVLKDSELYSIFNTFFENQIKENYLKLKKNFSNFIIENSKIKTEVEINRIFPKVLNPLAFNNDSKGSIKGKLSVDIITYDILMYNKNNFRDIITKKPKFLTRKEHELIKPKNTNHYYYEYLSSKAKKNLKKYNDNFRESKTEHTEERHIDKATHMHHIFPLSEYKEISGYIENIIALTPTQHLNSAHPNGNTHEINKQYQHLLLLSKLKRIEKNLKSENYLHIYDFKNFLFVLKNGFNNNNILDIEYMDFESIIKVINLHYLDKI